jgi:hypothetical protein
VLVCIHTAQRSSAERSGEVELHFGRDIAPGGFAWAVPVWRADRSFVRVGVMAEQNAPDYFSRMLERVSKRWGTPAHVDGSPRQKILPLSSLARTYRDRVIAGRRRRALGLRPGRHLTPAQRGDRR